MTRAVLWAQSAVRDLEAQLSYIAADNPAAALRVRRRIGDTVERLGNFATGRRGRVTGTYEQVVTGLPYVVVYRIGRDAGVETLRVLRVIHMARKWP